MVKLHYCVPSLPMHGLGIGAAIGQTFDQVRLWRYEQARLTNQVATDVTEDARSVANELVADGLFERIETEAMVRDNMMQLNIRCYNQNDILVVNRTFII